MTNAKNTNQAIYTEYRRRELLKLLAAGFVSGSIFGGIAVFGRKTASFPKVVFRGNRRFVDHAHGLASYSGFEKLNIFDIDFLQQRKVGVKVFDLNEASAETDFILSVAGNLDADREDMLRENNTQYSIDLEDLIMTVEKIVPYEKCVEYNVRLHNSSAKTLEDLVFYGSEKIIKRLLPGEKRPLMLVYYPKKGWQNRKIGWNRPLDDFINLFLVPEGLRQTNSVLVPSIEYNIEGKRTIRRFCLGYFEYYGHVLHRINENAYGLVLVDKNINNLCSIISDKSGVDVLGCNSSEDRLKVLKAAYNIIVGLGVSYKKDGKRRVNINLLDSKTDRWYIEDNCQLPSETLVFSGDCEDLTNLFAAVCSVFHIDYLLLDLPRHAMLLVDIGEEIDQDSGIIPYALWPGIKNNRNYVAFESTMVPYNTCGVHPACPFVGGLKYYPFYADGKFLMPQHAVVHAKRFNLFEDTKISFEMEKALLNSHAVSEMSSFAFSEECMSEHIAGLRRLGHNLSLQKATALANKTVYYFDAL